MKKTITTHLMNYVFLKLTFVILLLVLSVESNSQTFVSPINYVDNELNKEKVLLFITNSVEFELKNTSYNNKHKKDLLIRKNLKSFYKLTQIPVNNDLKKIITLFSGKGLYGYNYSTILDYYKKRDTPLIRKFLSEMNVNI